MRNLVEEFGDINNIQPFDPDAGEFRDQRIPEMDNIVLSIDCLDDAGADPNNLKPYYIPVSAEGSDFDRIMTDIGRWLYRKNAFDQSGADGGQRPLEEYRIVLTLLKKDFFNEELWRTVTPAPSVMAEYFISEPEQQLPSTDEEENSFEHVMVFLDRDKLAFQMQNAVRFYLNDMDELQERPKFQNKKWERFFRFASHPYPAVVEEGVQRSLAGPQLVAAA